MHMCVLFLWRLNETIKGEVGLLGVVCRWVCESSVSGTSSFSCCPCFSLQGEQGFLPSDLPPPLTVHPSIDDRHSPCSLTWLPHSKEAFQLLQGSTVWSCPVWLQTKHQRDSGTTSDHQTGLHVILTSCTKREWDGLRHSAFCVKLLTFYHPAPSSVYIYCPDIWAHFLMCKWMCSLSNFRTTLLPLWQMYCSN